MSEQTLPIPDLFDAAKVGSVWRIPYEERAAQARDWARLHKLEPASVDPTKTWLMLIDVQTEPHQTRSNHGSDALCRDCSSPAMPAS